MDYIREVSGYCPMQNRNTTIDAKYFCVTLPGNNGLKQYKKILHFCDYESDCTEVLCPVVKNASKTP